jgi:hypothetical protein
MTHVLVKISHVHHSTLLDHRIMHTNDAKELLHLFRSQPKFIVSLSGPHDWEEYLESFNLHIIDDKTIVDAFSLVYPNGINTLPIYDDIWRTFKEVEEEKCANYTESDDE